MVKIKLQVSVNDIQKTPACKLRLRALERAARRNGILVSLSGIVRFHWDFADAVFATEDFGYTVRDSQLRLLCLYISILELVGF